MTDERIAQTVSVILRAGVLISGSVVLAGGIYFLVRHGHESVHFAAFQSQPEIDRVVHQIVLGAVHLRARSVIQLGMLLLIATPLVRVGVSLVDFAFERDWKYVAITAVVFCLLMYGLISGTVSG
jgi:uncharacterized membrane protein